MWILLNIPDDEEIGETSINNFDSIIDVGNYVDNKINECWPNHREKDIVLRTIRNSMAEIEAGLNALYEQQDDNSYL